MCVSLITMMNLLASNCIGYLLLGQDCTRFQFECVNEGHPLADPQCIAVYDACDGIVHCADESDEKNCPAADSGIH